MVHCMGPYTRCMGNSPLTSILCPVASSHHNVAIGTLINSSVQCPGVQISIRIIVAPFLTLFLTCSIKGYTSFDIGFYHPRRLSAIAPSLVFG